MEDGLQVAPNNGLQTEQEEKYYAPTKFPDQYSDTQKITVNEPIDKSDGLHPVEKSQPPQKRIFGLNRFIFGGLIFCLAVIAIAIGLGVGLSKKGSKSNSTAPTPTALTSTGQTSSSPISTNLPAATPSSGATAFPACGCGVLAFDCPSVDQSRHNYHKGSRNFIYKYLCNEDFGAFTDPDNQSGVNDISIKNASTIEECTNSCTSWKLPNGPPCLGVTFHANLSFILGDLQQVGNCFLKKNVSHPTPFKKTRYGMSAILLP